MTVVVEEGETKGTTEAGCQTEIGVMRVTLKASQMNFPRPKMKSVFRCWSGRRVKILTSYLRSCNGLKNNLNKEVYRKCCLHWKCRDVRLSTSVFFYVFVVQEVKSWQTIWYDYEIFWVKLIFQQVPNTFGFPVVFYFTSVFCNVAGKSIFVWLSVVVKKNPLSEKEFLGTQS
jgi:hypothetical protein